MEKKKRGKKKSIGIIVVVVIVLAVVGWLALTFFTNPSPAPATGGGAGNGAAAEAPTSSAAAAYTGPVANTCTSSNADLGDKAIYTKGSVTAVDSNGNTQTTADYCADGTHLIEYICYESPAGSGKYASGRTIVLCKNGCVAGACKQ